jgi:hypothetical protein
VRLCPDSTAVVLPTGPGTGSRDGSKTKAGGTNPACKPVRKLRTVRARLLALRDRGGERERARGSCSLPRALSHRLRHPPPHLGANPRGVGACSNMEAGEQPGRDVDTIGGCIHRRDVLHEGSVQLQVGVDATNKCPRLRPRHLVLGPQSLEYYASQGVRWTAAPIGAIELRGVHQVAKCAGSDGTQFSIQGTHRSWAFTCANERECDSWVSYVTSTMAKVAARVSSPSSPPRREPLVLLDQLVTGVDSTLTKHVDEITQSYVELRVELARESRRASLRAAGWELAQEDASTLQQQLDAARAQIAKVGAAAAAAEARAVAAETKLTLFQQSMRKTTHACVGVQVAVDKGTELLGDLMDHTMPDDLMGISDAKELLAKSRQCGMSLYRTLQTVENIADRQYTTGEDLLMDDSAQEALMQAAEKAAEEARQMRLARAAQRVQDFALKRCVHCRSIAAPSLPETVGCCGSLVTPA